jgi:hypothetical protein
VIPRGAALLAVAVAFGAIHGIGSRGYDLANELEVAIGGVWYGALFELSGSLLPGIVAHMSYNAIGIWGQLAGFSWWIGVPLVIVGCTGLLGLAFWHAPARQRSGRGASVTRARHLPLWASRVVSHDTATAGCTRDAPVEDRDVRTCVRL